MKNWPPRSLWLFTLWNRYSFVSPMALSVFISNYLGNIQRWPYRNQMPFWWLPKLSNYPDVSLSEVTLIDYFWPHFGLDPLPPHFHIKERLRSRKANLLCSFSSIPQGIWHHRLKFLWFLGRPQKTYGLCVPCVLIWEPEIISYNTVWPVRSDFRQELVERTKLS